MISAAQIASKLSMTHRTIQRDLTRLRHLNILNRIGANKGGHWEINTKVEK